VAEPPRTATKRKFQGVEEGGTKYRRLNPDQPSENLADQHELWSDSILDYSSNEVPSVEELSKEMFASMPFRAQIDVVARSLDQGNNALWVSSFNSIYSAKKSEMANDNSCANYFLISRLMSHLTKGFTALESFYNPDFQNEAFTLLGLLARNSAACAMIHSLGGFHLALSKLGQSSCASSFGTCCFTLGNLVMGISQTQPEPFISIINSSGVITLLLATIQKNPQNGFLISSCCFLLANICFLSNFEQQILDSRGPHILAELLPWYTNDSQVVPEIIFLLRNLSHGDFGKYLQANENFLPALRYILNQHISNPELVSNCLGIFDALFTDSYSVLACDHNSIGLILRSINTHYNNPCVLRDSGGFLQRLFCFSDKMGQVSLLSAGIVGTIQKMELSRTMSNTLFAMFSRVNSSYYIVPPSPLPTLFDLCQRIILKNKLETNVLPPTLQSHLALERPNCFTCGGSTGDHLFIAMDFETIPQAIRVPVVRTLCSRKCFHHQLNKYDR